MPKDALQFSHDFPNRNLTRVCYRTEARFTAFLEAYFKLDRLVYRDKLKDKVS